ncbi:MAG: hypothetical protein E7271_02190 [Lachnospiraceae bacterium]|nr:hypothetical protein [Lachnospiraceae bacterium]
MKKIAVVLVVLLIGLCIALFMYLKFPSVQETVASYTEEDFVESNIYSNLDELAKRLDEEILKGEESFIVYVKNMDVGEIEEINHSLNSIYGSGAAYRQIGTVGDSYKKVEIQIKRNMNYYVLKAYMDNEPIPEGETKAKALYEKMTSILDTYIKPGMTDYEKELALHDYIVSHCHYSEQDVSDVESDIYTAYGALVNEDAVCNGYAEALQMMFTCVGVESCFVVGTAGDVDHAWNLVKLSGEWYHMDATWDDPLPDQGDKVMHPYFNVSDEVMASNHTWLRSDYPKAESMTYNYYQYNNQYFETFEEYEDEAYKQMVQHGNTRYEAVIEDYSEGKHEMQFMFEGADRYKSVNWQTFLCGKYRVLVLDAE